MTERVLRSREAEQLRSADFTHSEVGSTRGDTMPSGYATLRRTLNVGCGTERFVQAAQVLLGWDVHRRAGVRVRASSEVVGQGSVAVLRLGVGPLVVAAPVRVVYVVDELRRKGFAYGTLPGHPESGEEAFIFDLHDDDGDLHDHCLLTSPPRCSPASEVRSVAPPNPGSRTATYGPSEQGQPPANVRTCR